MRFMYVRYRPRLCGNVVSNRPEHFIVARIKGRRKVEGVGLIYFLPHQHFQPHPRQCFIQMSAVIPADADAAQ